MAIYIKGFDAVLRQPCMSTADNPGDKVVRKSDRNASACLDISPLRLGNTRMKQHIFICALVLVFYIWTCF